MRFSFLVLLAGTVIINATVVKAQDRGVDAIRGLLGVQAGNYSFVQFDKGELQKKYLDEVFKRSAEDRAYFQNSVTAIETEFKTLMTSAIYAEGVAEVKDGVLKVSKRGGLLWLSQQSTGLSAFITANDFLTSVNALHQARMALETRIATLTAIQEGALPSQVELKADGSGLDNVPQYGNLDFAPIKKFYEAKLAEVIKLTDNLDFKLVLADGSKHLNKGLVLPAAVLLLTPDQLLKMQDEILDKRSWGFKAHDVIDLYTVQTRQFIQDFITNYGPRWYKLNDNEIKKREEDAKQIAEALWTRSYLRAAYGMPIGAIGIDYDRAWFNLDFLTVSTNALSNFHEQPAWKEKELMGIEMNFRNCLLRAGVRAEKILDGNLGFLATGENLLTFLGGRRNKAQAQLMMLALLGADVYEERLIQRAGGIAKMKARFKDRYLHNDTDRKFYSSLRKDYDPQAGEQDTATGFNPDSVLGHFRKVRAHMLLKEADLALAAQLEATVNMATGANRFASERKSRVDDLFGPDDK